MVYNNVTFESKHHGVFATASSVDVERKGTQIVTANCGIVDSFLRTNIVAYGFKKTENYSKINTRNIELTIKSDGRIVLCDKGFHINNVNGDVAYISDM